jgi:hypothetical protein
MADSFEALNAELIRQFFEKEGLTLFEVVEKRGGGGVSKKVWLRALAGKRVQRKSRVAIGTFLKIDPTTDLLADRNAKLELVGGKWVVTPQPPEIDRTQPGPSGAPLPGTSEFYLRAIAGRWAGTSFVHAGEDQQGHEVPPQEFEWDVVVERSGTSLAGEGTCRTAGYEHGQYSLRASVNGLGLVMLDGVRGVGDGANNLFRALLKYHSDGRARTMEGGFVVNWAQHESIFLGWLKLRRVDTSPSQGRAELP